MMNSDMHWKYKRPKFLNIHWTESKFACYWFLNWELGKWRSVARSKIRNKKLNIHFTFGNCFPSWRIWSHPYHQVPVISHDEWLNSDMRWKYKRSTYPKFLNIHWNKFDIVLCGCIDQTWSPVQVHDVVIRINLTYSHCRRWSRLEIMIAVVTKWILSSGLAVDCGHLIAAALHSGIGNN